MRDEYGFADFGFPHRFRVEVSVRADFSSKTVIADHTGGDFPRPGVREVVIGGKGAKGRYVRVVATKLWSRRRVGEPLTDDWIFALSEMEVIVGGKIWAGGTVQSLDSIQAMPRWGRANLIDGRKGKGGGNEVAELEKERDDILMKVAGDEMLEKGVIEKDVAGLRAALGKLPKPRKIYAGMVYHGKGKFKGRGSVGGKPREIRVLDRGDVTKPLDVVKPGTVPGIVSGSGEFALPEGHGEGARRVALAEWVVHPENRLTWRSMVNRVWQQHFGTGIVATANDFGPDR